MQRHLFLRLWQLCSNGRTPKRVAASCVGWTPRQWHIPAARFPLFGQSAKVVSMTM